VAGREGACGKFVRKLYLFENFYPEMQNLQLKLFSERYKDKIEILSTHDVFFVRNLQILSENGDFLLCLVI